MSRWTQNVCSMILCILCLNTSRAYTPVVYSLFIHGDKVTLRHDFLLYTLNVNVESRSSHFPTELVKASEYAMLFWVLVPDFLDNAIWYRFPIMSSKFAMYPVRVVSVSCQAELSEI